MADKLFFVDPSSGLRKSYMDLHQEVNSITSIPRVLSSESCYNQFTTLVAAICRNEDFFLDQMSNGVYTTPDDFWGSDDTKIPIGRKLANTLEPEHQFDFLRSAASSTSEIGLFTSGTTGRPRMVKHRTDTLLRSVKSDEHHRDDVWGLTYHSNSFAGLQVFFQAICNLNPIVRLYGLRASAAHNAIRAEGITHLSATPTWFRLFCSDAVVHDQVQSVTTGGEIADSTLIKQIHACFPNARFRNIYASTESGSLLVSDGDFFRVPEDLLDRIQVQDGMLAIHQSLLAESLRSQYQSEFYVTGDHVEIVSEAPLTLRFIARRDDWINVGGYKVNPHEIERLLVAIDGVADARVFGRNNSVSGSIVCCEIVRSAGLSITQVDIRQAIEMQVESFMVPRFIRFVDAIDNTPTGKKDRSE